MDKLDRDLEYAISVECKTPLEDVADYEQVSSGFCRPMLASAKRWAGCLLHIHPGDSFWKPVGICLKHNVSEMCKMEITRCLEPGSKDRPSCF